MIIPNRNNPLNRGRVAWWLAKSGLWGGFSWIDLIHQLPVTYTSGLFPPIPVPERPGVGQIRYVTGTTPTVACLDVGASDITIAVWMKIFNYPSTINFLAGFNPSSPFNGYALAIVGHKLGYWNGQNTNYSTSTASVDTGAWVHALAASSGTGAGGQSNFYFNGVLDSQVTGTTAGQCSAWSGPRTFNGPVGSDGVPMGLIDVSIWNRQLSASEVWSLYTDSLTGYRQTLVGKRKLRSRGAAAAGGMLRPLALDGLGGTYMRDPLGV